MEDKDLLEQTDETGNAVPDWDDDSGEIHTVVREYNSGAEDGWHRNKAKYGSNIPEFREVKGKQSGFIYQTDDYRKVLPGYIIATVVVILLCVVMLILVPVMGVLITVFGVVFIIGFWKDAAKSSTKWKNQAKRLKDEKEIKDKEI